jgi:DNA-binding IclR family transcriptional regulator
MTLLSVDRTIEIIDMLIDRGDVGVTEVAEQLCVAPSTVHRVLQTLSMRKFVVQDEDTRRYLPGPRMTTMSYEIEQVARSRRPLEALGRSTGMTAHIGVLEGREVRYVHHWTPPARTAIGNRVGTKMPAHATSMGKALLSISTLEQIQKLFPLQGLPQSTPATISDRQVLLEELGSVRRVGYAMNIEESEPGVVGFARSISNSRLPVAMSVSAWLTEMQNGHRSEKEKHIADALFQASEIFEASHVL